MLKLDNQSTIFPGPASPAQRKYRDRLVVGIGHSLGGGGTAFAATACPSLFSSLIFVDPVLVAPQHPQKSTRPLAGGALLRRQEWKSREEALEGFKKKAFFRAWDEEMLKGYCEFGLKDTKDGVALKTTARYEAVSIFVLERQCLSLMIVVWGSSRSPMLPSWLPIGPTSGWLHCPSLFPYTTSGQTKVDPSCPSSTSIRSARRRSHTRQCRESKELGTSSCTRTLA